MKKSSSTPNVGEDPHCPVNESNLNPILIKYIKASNLLEIEKSNTDIDCEGPKVTEERRSSISKFDADLSSSSASLEIRNNSLMSNYLNDKKSSQSSEETLCESDEDTINSYHSSDSGNQGFFGNHSSEDEFEDENKKLLELKQQLYTNPQIQEANRPRSWSDGSIREGPGSLKASKRLATSLRIESFSKQSKTVDWDKFDERINEIRDNEKAHDDWSMIGQCSQTSLSDSATLDIAENSPDILIDDSAKSVSGFSTYMSFENNIEGENDCFNVNASYDDIPMHIKRLTTIEEESESEQELPGMLSPFFKSLKLTAGIMDLQSISDDNDTNSIDSFIRNEANISSDDFEFEDDKVPKK